MNERSKAAVVLKDFVRAGQILSANIGTGAINGHDVANMCREAIAALPGHVEWPALATADDKRSTIEATEHYLNGIANMAEAVQSAKDRNCEIRRAAEHN